MGFTKTIIQFYSDKFRFNFGDFVTGTLSLIQYGIDNNIDIRLNIADSYLSDYIDVTDTDMCEYPTKVYSTDTDLSLLYDDLQEFKSGTAALLVVSTNWIIHSSRVTDFAILEFKKLVKFKPALYSEARRRLTTQLLNINLPHTDPTINLLVPETHKCIRDPRIHSHPAPVVPLATDYSIIYVDVPDQMSYNYLDTIRLSETIRNSLHLDRNIMLISSDKELSNRLSELLEVNYVPELIVNTYDASGSLDSLTWEPVDEIINFIIYMNSKKIYVFSEQSKPVSASYLSATRMSSVSVQQFKFFYSKVEISPMPIFR
jgi:hypothetical protein